MEERASLLAMINFIMVNADPPHDLNLRTVLGPENDLSSPNQSCARL